MADVIDRDGFTADICVVRLPFGDDQVEHPCNRDANQPGEQRDAVETWHRRQDGPIEQLFISTRGAGNDRMRESRQKNVIFWGAKIKSAHRYICVHFFLRSKDRRLRQLLQELLRDEIF